MGPFLQNQKFSVTIIEPNNNAATLKMLTFTGFDEAIAIDHDLIQPFKAKASPLFKNFKCTKTCDGIIFFIKNNTPYILILDLKSSLSNEGEFKYKTMSGKNFISYINCVLSTFLNKNLQDWTILYAIFHEGSPKRETVTDPKDFMISRDANAPSTIKVNNGGTISINQLLGIPLIK